MTRGGGDAAPATASPTPDEVLSSYRISSTPPVYVMGAFDKGVTVLSQQVRALNLAWALAETGEFGATGARVAVVGAGFAGLTLAAALLAKLPAVEIKLFEERDTLVPLQQGSDTRWLHPHIYDWPSDGSEMSAAMLPVLNWTAARASDVVVQVLSEWRQIVEQCPSRVELYCNVRHLQVDGCRDHRTRARIEWVGERREPADGTTLGSGQYSVGASETFDHVFLAVGFGLEGGNPFSYWRNETLGQPSLDRPTRTFLVSGQGDGAMIDLLRLRISQYRQDRILDELFTGRGELRQALKEAKRDFDQRGADSRLFDSLERIAGGKRGDEAGRQFASVLEDLGKRLRRDTEVVLRLKGRSLEDLVDGYASRISFQNAVMVYLLYKCGGFAPSSETEAMLRKRHAIPDEQVVRRHGTVRTDVLVRILSDKLRGVLEAQAGELSQAAQVRWPGGYFGYQGSSSQANETANDKRASWRKEYLPGPTSLLAGAVCSAVKALLDGIWTRPGRFRVTLHRAITVGGERLLQQACNYRGERLGAQEDTSGRTFSAYFATIGQAYRLQRTVRSREGADPSALQAAMDQLGLARGSRRMDEQVRFVLAIPVLHVDGDGAKAVIGTVYVDGSGENDWLDDGQVDRVSKLVGTMLQVVVSEAPPNGIRDFPTERPVEPSSKAPHSHAGTDLPTDVETALEMVNGVEPPTIRGHFWFNLDHTDLPPARRGRDGG